MKVLLLASREAITRAWHKGDPPTREQWLSIVGEKWKDYRRGEDDTTSNDN